MFIFKSNLVGAVARWAVEQSPYPVPDNLETVLRKLWDSMGDDEFPTAGMRQFEDSRDIDAFLSPRLRAIPEYVAWNERKNGNTSPLQFVSRYDGPGNPDDDFIDLDALERNVALSITKGYAE